MVWFGACPGRKLKSNGRMYAIPHRTKPGLSLCCMLHGSLLGDADAGTGFVLPRPVPPPENRSESGKIAAIGEATFSLEVVKGQQRQTIEFLVDGDTKVEGKLQIGSQATVEYRTADGKNVAVRVVVRSASGLKAR